MTNSQSQAQTLGILLWIFAGIQALFAIFYVVLILFYGAAGFFSLLAGGADAAAGGAVIFVIVILFVVLLAFGIASIVLNIKAGIQLKKPTPASKNLLLASSIANLLSFLMGGLCLAPFGLAMGGYGLYFTLSDVGQAYFNGGGSQSPPPIGEYRPGTFGNPNA